MSISALDVLKVVFEITMPDSAIGANVYWFRVQDPTPDNPSDAQVVTAVDSYLNDCYTALDTIVGSDYGGGDFTVEKMEWDVDKWETVENIGTGDVAWTPTGGTASLPHGVAGVVTGRTARPQTRGRKFIPGIYEAGADNSSWIAAILTALAAYGVQYLLDTTITGSAYIEPVVAGRTGPSAGLIYPLTQAVVPGISGYQRRRKPGVGQ